jgi:hypothetical protein
MPRKMLIGPPEAGASADRHGTAGDASDRGEFFWQLLFNRSAKSAPSVISVGCKLWGQYLALRNESAAIGDLARIGGAVAREIGKLALMPADSPTRFKGKPGTVKRVAWSEPISLAEIKATGKALGCSVNDTLLAAAAGALRGYLMAKGDVVNGAEIRVMVPVNLRAPNDSGDLGNRFGLVALELPVGIENPLARLYATRARMAALKGSYQALLTYALLGAAGMAPGFVEEQLLRLLAGKTTAVMTNVPGSQQPRYLAGQSIDQQMVWVPQAGDIGMGVSILSYNQRVQLGVITDKGMVDDPQNIVDRFADEFEKLLWLVLLQPGDRLADPDAVAEDLARSPPTSSQADPRRPRETTRHGYGEASISQFGPRRFDIEALHRIHRREGRGFLIEALGILHFRLAKHHHQGIRILDAGNRRIGVKLQSRFEEFVGGALLDSVGHSPDQRSDLVEHLGVIGAQRDTCVGVPGLQFESLHQAVFDLAAEALRQRLDHRDALAVAAKGVGVQIPAIGVARRFLPAAPRSAERLP